MSHPFGELLKLHRVRKNGLSQARLAQIVGYDPAIIARMAQGRRDLTGPSGRDRIVRLIGALRDEGVLHTLDEANALLTAANLPPLFHGLPVEAAILRTLTPTPAPPTTSAMAHRSLPSGSLPVPLSSFIGRESAIGELTKRLGKTRLLTLTGPGGSGKTRLAIELAAGLAGTFENGVRWVELEPANDAEAVWQAVALAAGVPVEATTSREDALIERWRNAHALLVLDNCEHVLDATAHLAERLLTACPRLKLLLTSREALGVFGETVWTVPPLSTPLKANDSPERLLTTSDSVRLFCERASAISQTFVLTPNNAPYVAHICLRLEGLPLAIELAAAHARALSAKQIAAMLKDQLGLLTKGSRTAPSRQQTLRATIDWSYNRLTDDERRVLQHVSVFSGGFELDALVALERAAGSPLSEVQLAAVMSALVGKSLVKLQALPDDVARYSSLVMLREYAADKLTEHGEDAAARRWHAQACLMLAEAFEPHWHIDPRWQVETHPRQTTDHMGIRMAREQDNLRAALTWCLSPEGSLALGLRLAGRMWSYWWIFAAQEGIHWLTRLLDENATMTSAVEVEAVVPGRALLGLGNLLLTNDEARARQTLEDALRILRGEKDVEGTAVALCSLSRLESDIGCAWQLLTEALDLMRGADISLVLAREWALFHGPDILRRWSDPENDDGWALIDAAGEPHLIAAAMLHLGYVAMVQLDLRLAQTLAEQALRVTRPMGAGTEAGLLMLAGESAQLSGDLDAAQSYLQRAYDWGSQHARMWEGACALALLGRVARDRGEVALARAHFSQVLHLQPQFTPAIFALEGLACVECMDGHFERAVRLFGAADGYRAAINNPAWEKDSRDMARYVAEARAHLGAAAYDAAFAVGHAMTIEQVVAFALQGDE